MDISKITHSGCPNYGKYGISLFKFGISINPMLHYKYCKKKYRVNSFLSIVVSFTIIAITVTPFIFIYKKFNIYVSYIYFILILIILYYLFGRFVPLKK